jgi:3-oxoacyl-[acyl-carrier-protein] synthase-3
MSDDLTPLPGPRHFPGSLIDIAYCLPQQVLRNTDLAALYPGWNVAQTEKRTGVQERRVARPDETAYDLALQATRDLLAHHPGLAAKVDAIVFCTQTPDHVMPSNAFLLQRDLKLGTHVLAFDYNLACSGYVYGLMMASSFIATGVARHVLVVTAETYSKHIAEADRATRMLFGDGAAVSWVGVADDAGVAPLITAFTDFKFASDGTGWNKFYVKSGAARQPVSQRAEPGYNDRIQMDGLQVLNFVGDRVVGQVADLLRQHGLTPPQVDQYFLHQASRLALDAMSRKLGVGPDKVCANLARIGNTVSASIPILIKDHFTQGPVAPGSRLLLCGYGVGYSWGSLLARR